MRLIISASVAAGLTITAPTVFAQPSTPTPFSKLFLVPGQAGYRAFPSSSTLRPQPPPANRR
jgi:hypothetical protein